jgi:hypothetical protein
MTSQALRLLDSAQWKSLTAAQRTLVGSIYGNDTGGGYKTALSRGGRQLVESLAAKGLITAEWQERTVTLRLRMEGWS